MFPQQGRAHQGVRVRLGVEGVAEYPVDAARFGQGAAGARAGGGEAFVAVFAVEVHPEVEVQWLVVGLGVAVVGAGHLFQVVGGQHARHQVGDGQRVLRVGRLVEALAAQPSQIVAQAAHDRHAGGFDRVFRGLDHRLCGHARASDLRHREQQHALGGFGQAAVVEGHRPALEAMPQVVRHAGHVGWR